MTRILPSILLLSFCVLSLALGNTDLIPKTNESLIFVQVLYRHGARSPSRTFPNDPYQTHYWPRGWKQMTQNGLKQQYELGRYLRMRYMDQHPLLSSAYDENEIYVRSTSKARALQSAAANLAGLYGLEYFVENDLYERSHVQLPIPVHGSRPTNQDILLKPTSVPCPAYEALDSKRPEFPELDEQFSDLLEFLQETSGLKKRMTAAQAAKYVYSAWEAEVAEGLDLPEWAHITWKGTNQTVFDIVKNFKRKAELSHYEGSAKSKLLGGYLLNNLMARFKERLSGEEEVPSKMYMYSTHQETLHSLMFNMGITNHLLVPYASALMLELWDVEGEPEVRIFYRNETASGPYAMPIPLCSRPESCPLQEMERMFRGNIIKSRSDWQDECKAPIQPARDEVQPDPLVQDSSSMLSPLVLGGSFVLILIQSMYLYFKHSKS